jgi:hypothetical protein
VQQASQRYAPTSAPGGYGGKHVRNAAIEMIHQLRAAGDCLARTRTPGPSAEAPCCCNGTLRGWPNGHACLLDTSDMSQGSMGAVCRFKRATTMGSTMPKCLLIMPSEIAKPGHGQEVQPAQS